MIKKILQNVIIVMIVNFSLYADINVKFGNYRSYITGFEENDYNSLYFGIGVEKFFSTPLLYSFSSGINIINLGGAIKNGRTDNFDIGDHTTSYYDFDIALKFVELPFNLSFKIFGKDKIRLLLNSGISVCIPLSDNSKLNLIKTIQGIPESDYGYIYMMDPPSLFSNSQLKYNFGLTIEYQFIGLNINISQIPTTLSHIDTFKFEEKLHSNNYSLILNLTKFRDYLTQK